jgi:hypothetical protein
MRATTGPDAARQVAQALIDAADLVEAETQP